jgi:hypothetical protein
LWCGSPPPPGSAAKTRGNHWKEICAGRFGRRTFGQAMRARRQTPNSNSAPIYCGVVADNRRRCNSPRAGSRNVQAPSVSASRARRSGVSVIGDLRKIQRPALSGRHGCVPSESFQATTFHSKFNPGQSRPQRHPPAKAGTAKAFVVRTSPLLLRTVAQGPGQQPAAAARRVVGPGRAARRPGEARADEPLPARPLRGGKPGPTSGAWEAGTRTPQRATVRRSRDCWGRYPGAKAPL